MREESSPLFKRKEKRSMRKAILVTVLSLALIFGYGTARFTAEEEISPSQESSGVSNLIGTTVKDSRGEYVGIITDLATGPEGRDAFAILGYWISDDTRMRVAVPMDALSCQEQNCVLRANREALNAAPVIVPEDELAERKRAEDIYRLFGVQPYWTEE
jgi:hypothetical protein